MRQANLMVIDEFIPASATTYTSANFNGRLGAFDQIALHIIVDNVSATSTLNIFVEHSADDRNFIQRNNMQVGTTLPGTTGDVTFNVAVGGFYQLLWADACTGNTGQVTYATGAVTPKDCTNTPLLPFVRLKLVAGSGSGCHVKIHAALRGPR